MARSDSDGGVAAALLADWLRQLLVGARHRPMTAEDLVFRDLHALVAGHPNTADHLAGLTDETGRYGAASDDTVLALSRAVDRVAGTDEAFALPLAELVRILRPLLDPVQYGYAATEPLENHNTPFDGETTQAVAAPGWAGTRSADSEPVRPAAPPVAIPVTVYLSDAAGSERVEAAVELLLASAGVEITERDDPVHGSWFRRMRARFAGSPAAQGFAATAMHAVESQLVHAQDATVTANLMQNLGPTIAALQDYDEAVIRAGALLVVKIGPRLTVHQLTPAQQFRLDHQPELARSPHHVLTALQPDEPAIPTEDWLA